MPDRAPEPVREAEQYAGVPDAFQRLWTPHRWAYEAYAEIQRRGGGVADVLPQLGVLVAMTALLLPLGAWLLQRSLSRAM